MKSNQVSEEARKRESAAEHWFWRAISPPLVIAIVINAAVVAMGYGRLGERVDALTRQMDDMQRMQITPGASTAIEGIRAKDEAQDEAIAELRAENRESRKEIMGAISGLAEKIDRHMDTNRK